MRAIRLFGIPQASRFVQYRKLDSKLNKSPEDKTELKKLERQVDHWKNRQDYKGENHSKNAKGNR